MFDFFTSTALAETDVEIDGFAPNKQWGAGADKSYSGLVAHLGELMVSLDDWYLNLFERRFFFLLLLVLTFFSFF